MLLASPSMLIHFHQPDINLDVVWEERISTKELSPSVWPVGMCVDIYLIDDRYGRV